MSIKNLLKTAIPIGIKLIHPEEGSNAETSVDLYCH